MNLYIDIFIYLIISYSTRCQRILQAWLVWPLVNWCPVESRPANRIRLSIGLAPIKTCSSCSTVMSFGGGPGFGEICPVGRVLGSSDGRRERCGDGERECRRDGGRGEDDRECFGDLRDRFVVESDCSTTLNYIYLETDTVQMLTQSYLNKINMNITSILCFCLHREMVKPQFLKYQWHQEDMILGKANSTCASNLFRKMSTNLLSCDVRRKRTDWQNRWPTKLMVTKHVTKYPHPQV